MSKRFRLLLSGAFALLALVGCLAYGEAVRSEAEVAQGEALEKYGGEVTAIVVAKRDLEVGDVVSDVNCEVRDWVAALVPEGAVTSLEETAGTALTSPISKGTPLTEVALRDASETLDIPAGMAAYTIAVNERTGILSSVPLGTTLVAYQIADGATQLISSDVVVIGRDPDGGSKITVAIPYEDVSDLIRAATDRSLRLVQPSGLSDGLDDSAIGDEYWTPDAEGELVGDGAVAGDATEPAPEAAEGSEGVEGTESPEGTEGEWTAEEYADESVDEWSTDEWTTDEGALDGSVDDGSGEAL